MPHPVYPASVTAAVLSPPADSVTYYRSRFYWKRKSTTIISILKYYSSNLSCLGLLNFFGLLVFGCWFLFIFGFFVFWLLLIFGLLSFGLYSFLALCPFGLLYFLAFWFFWPFVFWPYFFGLLSFGILYFGHMSYTHIYILFT